MRLVFQEEHEFYLFYYSANFKDHVLFKQTQSCIKIDVILVKKKHVFFYFVEKYVRLNEKMKFNVIMTINIEYASICFNGPK